MRHLSLRIWYLPTQKNYNLVIVPQNLVPSYSEELQFGDKDEVSVREVTLIKFYIHYKLQINLSNGLVDNPFRLKVINSFKMC